VAGVKELSAIVMDSGLAERHRREIEKEKVKLILVPQ
jgi:hypothetical protein